MVTSFTQLKKMLREGDELYCTHNYAGPCKLYRKLVKVQTNAFAFAGDGFPCKNHKMGWTYYPKTAKEVEILPNGFAFNYGVGADRMRIVYEYKTLQEPK